MSSIEAARLFGGICVAASPVPLASPGVAWQVERAVAEATGSPVLRCHPHPGAMVGPVGAVRSLLAALVGGGSDADRMTEAVLSGRHDVVLDISSQFFHVLDGTGTDVDMVAGRARVGDEQPLVLIDPGPDARTTALNDAVERPYGMDHQDTSGQPIPVARLHRLAVASLAQLATELDAAGADDTRCGRGRTVRGGPGRRGSGRAHRGRAHVRRHLRGGIDHRPRVDRGSPSRWREPPPRPWGTRWCVATRIPTGCSGRPVGCGHCCPTCPRPATTPTG